MKHNYNNDSVHPGLINKIRCPSFGLLYPCTGPESVTCKQPGTVHLRYGYLRLSQVLGINGNTHMMMGDTNSDQIAEVLLAWLVEINPD
jgi:hypothetical protein